jgi:hypothetical protein
MIGRRCTAGLSLFSALLVLCVLAASSAHAVVRSTTAFTCKGGAAASGFKDAHCTESTGVQAEVKFVHEPIPAGKETFVHITNEKTFNKTTERTPAILKTNVLGIETEITCAKITGHGKVTNKLEPASEVHWVHGTEITLHYTSCIVLKPVKSNCKVKGEEILIEPHVTATTKEEGDNINFKPEIGKIFGTVTIEGCEGLFAILNGEHEIAGSFKGQPNGATINFNHKTITAEKTLTVSGQTAGLEGSVTVSQAEETQESAGTGNPISVTTIETP